MESKCHKLELSVFKSLGKEKIKGCKIEFTDKKLLPTPYFVTVTLNNCL